MHLQKARGKLRIAQMRGPHDQPMTRVQTAVDHLSPVLPVLQHGEQLYMAGLGDKSIGDDQVAKGVENAIDLPL